MRHQLSLAALLALSAAWACPSYGQDDAAIVCGTPLNNPGSLSWQRYLDFAESPLEAIDHAALAKVIAPHFVEWPQPITDRMAGALNAFASSNLPARALAIDPGDLGDQPVAFRNTDFPLELPTGAEHALCTPPQGPARIQAAYAVLLMARANAAANVTGANLVALRIAELETQYDRYLFEGFPMFPWEAWANSKFLTTEHIANGPPRHAMVLFHPGAGVVQSIESDSRTDAGATLSVEPFGWIWYSEDYSKWWGVSLLAVLPSDRNAGSGVAFNYNNFKFGVTWHDDDGDEHDGLGIFLGMDFMQFLGEKQRKYEGYKKELRSLASGGNE